MEPSGLNRWLRVFLSGRLVPGRSGYQSARRPVLQALVQLLVSGRTIGAALLRRVSTGLALGRA
eukprot:3820313-Rhodomonas_salina.3